MITHAPASLLEERLAWIDAALHDALAPVGEDLEVLRRARYHLGWCDAGFHPLPAAERRRRGGKRVRGLLAVLACEASGGCGRAAAPAAAAVELLHNSSLVFDDVQDGDAERRGRPSVWALWGVAQALNVGTTLQALAGVAALRPLSPVPVETAAALAGLLSHTVVRMAEGQQLDLAHQDADGVTVDAYLRMAEGKTGVLMGAALRAGAMVAGMGGADAEALERCGMRMGVAFQCLDDAESVRRGAPHRGKPSGSDLLRGKRSLPVVGALELYPPDTLAGWALRRALSDRDVPGALTWLQAPKVAEWTRARVQEQTAAALDALAAAPLAGPAGDAIRVLAHRALTPAPDAPASELSALAA